MHRLSATAFYPSWGTTRDKTLFVRLQPIQMAIVWGEAIAPLTVGAWIKLLDSIVWQYYYYYT